MVSGFRQQLYRSLEPSERSIIDGFYDMNFDEQREHVSKSYKWLTTQFNNKEMWDGFIPWDHQQEAVISAAKHASNSKNDPHFIYEIPTGGGKTTVFIEQNIACAIKNEDTGRRIAMPSIIIVPTEKLATDTQKRFKKEYPDTPVGIYYGREKDIQPLTVMTIDSYVSAVESGFIQPEDVVKLDIDEAHRGLSELRQGTSNKFKGNTIISAYSATPIFDAMKNVFDFLGKSNVIARVSLKRLIKDKVVAPINNYILNVHIDYDKEKYTPEAQEQIIAVARLSAAYEFMNEGKDPETGKGFAGDTTLMYLNKTKNSVNGAKYFNDRLERDKGDKKPFTKLWNKFKNFAESVTTRKSPEKRKEVFSNLREAVTAVGFNVGMIREGVDIRRATNAFDLVGMGSLIDKLQSVGRIIRSWAEKPDKEANAIDMATYVNGRMRGSPIHYYEAVGDKSLLKGIIDVNVDLDWILKKAQEQGIKIVEKPAKDKDLRPKKDDQVEVKNSQGEVKEGKEKPDKSPVEIVEVSQIDEAGQKVPITNVNPVKRPKLEKPQVELIGAAENLLQAESLVFDFKKDIHNIERFTREREESKNILNSDEWLAKTNWMEKFETRSLYMDVVFKAFNSKYQNYADESNPVLVFNVNYSGKKYEVKCIKGNTSGLGEDTLLIHKDSSPLIKLVAERGSGEFLELKDAEDITGLKRGVLLSRAKSIKPDNLYNIMGLPAKHGEEAFKGDTIIKRHPYNVQKQTVKNSVVEKWKEVEEYKSSLKDRGYISFNQLKKEGVSSSRLNNLKKEFKENSITSEKPLIWENPYNYKDTYISPELYIDLLKIETFKKKLIDNGYKTAPEIKEMGGSYSKIRNLKNASQVSKGFKDQKPLIWENPNLNKETFYSPKAVTSLVGADNFKENLINKGYKQLQEVAETSSNVRYKFLKKKGMVSTGTDNQSPDMWRESSKSKDIYVKPEIAEEFAIRYSKEKPTNKITDPKHDGKINEQDISKGKK